jgi:hypothetical protein
MGQKLHPRSTNLARDGQHKLYRAQRFNTINDHFRRLLRSAK